jgi:hypothetical protein
MMLSRPLQRVPCLLILKDALFISRLDHNIHDVFVEFWVSLNRDEFVFLVHSLYEAARRCTKLLNIRRILEDNVFVHLVNCLDNECESLVPNEKRKTYEGVLLEYLFAFGAQLYRQNGYLPSVIASADLDS